MTTTLNQFATDYKKEKLQQEEAIYNEYKELISQDGASVGKVTRFLMEKYNIHSESTVWCIRKRVEKRYAEMKRNA